MKHLLLVAALLPLAACSDPEPEGPVPDPALEAYLKDPLAYTRGQIDEIMTRPEHEDPIVEVQHILVSFKGAPKMSDAVTRSIEDAELHTVELYGDVLRGKDFETLMQEHSDDTGLGTYLMTLKPGGGMS
ncbi:MAG: peptidylprolyl isomerase, partial [Planctomycetota bacterium]|nr:peptidylprolyl isomerase [Planctomycetota bacterium]